MADPNKSGDPTQTSVQPQGPLPGVGPKAENHGAASTGRGEPPEPGATWQDPGLEKSGAEFGKYAGDAMGRLVGSELGPAGEKVLGQVGSEFGRMVGGTLGSVADTMFGYYTPGGDGGMSTPESGAGMSLPQGASVDADHVGTASTNTAYPQGPNASHDPSMSEPNASHDPSMSEPNASHDPSMSEPNASHDPGDASFHSH
jgi:hypothetical protein